MWEERVSSPDSQFQPEDLKQVPAPGLYWCSIRSARFRTSASGNRMLQVIHDLDAPDGSQHSVPDYFVLSGQAASAAGIALSRRRLAQLYRACGRDPSDGQQIDPAQLVGARLQIRVEPELWLGQWRLRVAGYLPGVAQDDTPF